MLSYRNIVSNDAELLRCVLFSTPVMIVNNNNNSILAITVINSYDEHIIIVDGSFFFRSEIHIQRLEIKSNADFFNSIIFQSSVEIHSEGSIDYKIINDFNDEFIFVDNAFYFRSHSKFFVA